MRYLKNEKMNWANCDENVLWSYAMKLLDSAKTESEATERKGTKKSLFFMEEKLVSSPVALIFPSWSESLLPRPATTS
jgi:hypothetical protein